MEPRVPFEAGIIKTFRLFSIVRLAICLFSLALYLLTYGRSITDAWFFLELMLVDAGLLVAYLSIPRLPRILKHAYLPIALVWATVGPILELHIIYLQFISLDYDPVRLTSLWALQSILMLFIPLVITAWRYSMKTVIHFCALTFFFDLVLLAITYKFYDATFYPQIINMAIIRTILFLLLGYMIANLVKVQREQNLRLTEANEQLAQYAGALEQLTISRERNRMARELHDVLAHTMSGVAVELEGVRAMLRVDPDQAEALLGHSLVAVREGLTETRRALKALRATPLEDLGLGLAVRNLVESIAGRAGLQTSLQIENDMPDYPAEVQQSFYRVAQEALTNIVAHSQATQVFISMGREGAALKLSIRDNGIGFDERSIDLTQKYGLLGMRERVEMIHGQLSIDSQVGAGTQIILIYEAGRFSGNPMEISNE